MVRGKVEAAVQDLTQGLKLYASIDVRLFSHVNLCGRASIAESVKSNSYQITAVSKIHDTWARRVISIKYVGLSEIFGEWCPATEHFFRSSLVLQTAVITLLTKLMIGTKRPVATYQ